MTTPRLSRRDWLKLAAAGVVSCPMAPWFARLAEAAAPNPKRKRACILLYMNGGASQMDTFDCKPGTKNGGPTQEIATSVPGLKVSENLPKVAQQMHHLAVIRSMATKEGDHTRAAYNLRTGYLPTGSIQYPTLGSLVSKELGQSDAALPNFVSVAPATFLSPAAYSSGFLGPEYAPLMIGNAGYGFGPAQNYSSILKVQDLLPPREVEEQQVTSRLELVKQMQGEFAQERAGVIASSHQAAYERAVRLMRTAASKAFELDEEKDKLRDAYGRNLFGQGCLLARRLIERGVPFVEVTLSNAPGAQAGWDTHQDNFNQVKALCNVLDPAWATLITDLKERGLLDTTTIVWMGEFGRTPQINGQRGRDHFPNAWTTVIGGGGVRGGQAYGKTSKDGTTVEEKSVTVPNFVATVVKALGIDPTKQNMSNVGRPIRIADAGSKPITEVLA
ncbi:MAG: DUF1501 domain-containing protein [Gemmataceae bacterium]